MLAASPAITACAGIGDVAPEAVGLGAGAGAGVVTANPLIGLVVGLGTRLIAAEAIGYVRSEQKFRVQQAIAQAAGNATGTRPVPWSTPPDDFFDTVLGAGHGHLQVVRDLGDRIRCREILYDIASNDDLLETTTETVEADVAGSAGPAPEPAVTSPAAAVPGHDGGAFPLDQPDPWPQAGADPVKAAVVCYGALGWQWAVSEPATSPL